MSNRHTSHGRIARAFTLIELLVVITIIGLLIGLVGVVYGRIIVDTQRGATEQYLNAIKTGIEQFKSDHNYYPPLLYDDPNLGEESYFVPEAQDGAHGRTAVDTLAEARYYSMHSLAVYLIGVGDINPDPDAEADEQDGVAGPGFRSPGPDKSWGGANDREVETHRAVKSGRTYGPYVDVASGDRIRQVEPSDFSDRFDPFPANNQTRFFSTLVDRWGNPIRYYRYWPTRIREAGCNEQALTKVPLELLSTQALRSSQREACNTIVFDPASDRDLFSAEYALLSAGPDGEFGSTGDDAKDRENSFVKGRIGDVDAYDNFEFFEALRGPGDPEKAKQYEALLKSIGDNVRVLQ